MPETLVKEHMEVIGADGVHIGTVDRVENGRIKLTKADSGEGRHKGHNHFIDLSLVADVEGQKRFASLRTLQSLSRWKKSSPQSQCDGMCCASRVHCAAHRLSHERDDPASAS